MKSLIMLSAHETIHRTSRSVVIKRSLFEELLCTENQEAVKFECKSLGMNCYPD